MMTAFVIREFKDKIDCEEMRSVFAFSNAVVLEGKLLSFLMDLLVRLDWDVARLNVFPSDIRLLGLDESSYTIGS